MIQSFAVQNNVAIVALSGEYGQADISNEDSHERLPARTERKSSGVNGTTAAKW